MDCEREGAELTLAPSAADGLAPAVRDADLDPSVELPFAVEPGTAVALGGRFFVSALRHEPHGGVALLGRIDARRAAAPAASANTVLELARIDGEVPPARLATDGEDLIVALETPRPSGFQIRVARLARADVSLPLVWQNGPELSRGESNTFDVAAAAGRTLIAWDDWPPQSKLGRVFIALLEPGADGANAVPRAVSPADADAEEPRVVARPGGYWIAWLVNARAGENAARVYDPGEAETDTPVPAPPASTGRAVELLALDSTGHPVGHVRRLTGGKERVVGYDLASSVGGDAWIGWRQDAASAGAAGGRILFAEVRSEGAPKIVAVREGDVGSGEPIWLALPPPSAGNVASEVGTGVASPWLTWPWLTFPDQRDRTVLLPIALSASAPAKPGTPLALGAELEGATALASIDGQLLFAQPRGRAVRLISAHCNPVAAAALAGADAGATPQP